MISERRHELTEWVYEFETAIASLVPSLRKNHLESEIRFERKNPKCIIHLKNSVNDTVLGRITFTVDYETKIRSDVRKKYIKPHFQYMENVLLTEGLMPVETKSLRLECVGNAEGYTDGGGMKCAYSIYGSTGKVTDEVIKRLARRFSVMNGDQQLMGLVDMVTTPVISVTVGRFILSWIEFNKKYGAGGNAKETELIDKYVDELSSEAIDILYARNKDLFQRLAESDIWYSPQRKKTICLSDTLDWALEHEQKKDAMMEVVHYVYYLRNALVHEGCRNFAFISPLTGFMLDLAYHKVLESCGNEHIVTTPLFNQYMFIRQKRKENEDRVME